MEETIGNTPSEMLNLLVDGELETSQEVALYASLTENDELRNEMREILAIRESIRKDTEAFTPPRNSRKSVLAAVGLAPGGVINAPITQVAIQTGFWGGFWGKILMPVASAVVATIITSLMFMNYYKPGDKSAQTGNQMKNVPVVSSVGTSSNEIKSVNTNNNAVAPPARKTRNNLISNNNRIIPVPDVIIVENNDMREPASVAYASLGTDLYRPAYLDYSNSVNNVIPVISVSPKQFETISQWKKPNLGITLMLRGIASRSFPTVELPSQSNPLLRNIALGGYVRLSDGLDVGFEIGQENFGLIYYDKTEGGIINKNPILGWVGLGIKGKITKPVDFLAGGKPYLQVFAGGTELGPTGKILCGLEYSWDDGLGFIIGMEGGSLFYNANKKWYSTEKFGFNYGMLYSF